LGASKLRSLALATSSNFDGFCCSCVRQKLARNRLPRLALLGAARASSRREGGSDIVCPADFERSDLKTERLGGRSHFHL
jgi:hypothetical protein